MNSFSHYLAPFFSVPTQIFPFCHFLTTQPGIQCDVHKAKWPCLFFVKSPDEVFFSLKVLSKTLFPCFYKLLPLVKLQTLLLPSLKLHHGSNTPQNVDMKNSHCGIIKKNCIIRIIFCISSSFPFEGFCS